MSKCNYCYSYSDTSPCPACKRNSEVAKEQEKLQQDLLYKQERLQQDLLYEQERLQQEQIYKQEEIAKNANLNAFKLRLLDVAILAHAEPEKASAAALVMMRSTTFTENIDWFWRDVFENKFLARVYFEEALVPLQADDDATNYLDSFNRKVLMDAESWLQCPENTSDWKQRALIKIKHYKEVVHRREVEQERVNILHREEQRRADEVLSKSMRRRHVYIWLQASILTLIHGAIYLASGWWLHNWRRHNATQIPQVTEAANYAIGGVFLVILIFTSWAIYDYYRKKLSNKRDDSWSPIITFLLILLLLVTYWSSVTDLQIKIAMLASLIILPLIPRVRGLIALASFSIFTGFIAFYTSWFIVAVFRAALRKLF